MGIQCLFLMEHTGELQGQGEYKVLDTIPKSVKFCQLITSPNFRGTYMPTVGRLVARISLLRIFVLRTWYICSYFHRISLSPFFPVLLRHELLIR
jgi:hypothetical protein